MWIVTSSSSATPDDAVQRQVLERVRSPVGSRVLSRSLHRHPSAVKTWIAVDQQDRPEGHQGRRRAPSDGRDEAAADQRHAQAVQAVRQQSEHEEHVQPQEQRGGGELEEPVPRGFASQELGEHGEVQVQVEDQPEAGDPVQREREVAGAAAPDVEPRGGARRLPLGRGRRRVRAPPGVWSSVRRRSVGSSDPTSGTAVPGAAPAASFRRAMIRWAGRTFEGQASVHSNAAWHRHAAMSWSAQSSNASRSTVPGSSSSIRWANARAAGPT